MEASTIVALLTIFNSVLLIMRRRQQGQENACVLCNKKKIMK